MVEDLADFYEILDDFPREHLTYTRTCSSKDDCWSLFNAEFDNHTKLPLTVITDLRLIPEMA